MPAQTGDTVRVHYTGRLDDETVFDSSEGREPLAFTLGVGEVVAGFDAAVATMEVGDRKTVRLPADEAYGARDPERLLVVPTDAFPDGVQPAPGQRLQLGVQGGGAIEATVTEVGEDGVTLDANHPLAGQALTFDLTRVE
ncbi:peptidylprolyl isomerase [Rubrivirga sp. S365]|uniref:FKBP-type peptidyl-prolyl cis-trans isomerase n=1 Tax=Rubrivirga sp. S365 TaxID=3076080 RepID=UPI0028C79A56|nr:peptidylprolyl isomerase [Rubrivirga sp. S365]MDT7857688.1 peptidylprolyl isomerase [Rubrivirga sp. S365]